MALACFLATASYSANPPIPKTLWVRDWQRAKAFTAEYLEAMPEDGYSFRPTPEIRSFAEQMLHLANVNYNFASAIAGKDNPYKDGALEKSTDIKTKAAVLKAVMDSYDFMINAISSLNDAQLAETTDVFGMPMLREEGISKAFEHQTHHRGQTTIYLRLKGVTPPSEMIFDK